MGDNRKILIEIVTKTSGAEKKVKKTGDAVEKTGKQADKASKSFFGLGKTLGAIARGFIIVKGFQLLAQTISSSIKVAAEFELTMAKVKAISGATEEEFQKLTASARELALGTTFTASQIGELNLAYSKLGFTTDEILAATEATLQLATATGEDLAGAADVVGASIRGFGLAADDTQRVVDIMAKAFSSSALNLENFKQSMKTVAPIARAANIDIETSSALLGKLADAGLRGTRAATGLKNLMSQLTDPTSELAKELGFTVKNSEGLMHAFRELSKRGIDLSKATGLVDERSKAAFITLVNGTAGVDDLRHALDNASGSAESMAAIVGGTLIGSYKMLQSQIEETQIAITNSDFMKNLADTMSVIVVLAREGLDESRKLLKDLDVSERLQKDLKEVLDAEKKFFKERREQNKIFAEENKRIIDEVDDKKKASDLLNQRSIEKTERQEEELTQFRLSQIKLLEEKEKELKAELAAFGDKSITANIERIKLANIGLEENISKVKEGSSAYLKYQEGIKKNNEFLKELDAEREKETDSLKKNSRWYKAVAGTIEKVQEVKEKLKTSTKDATGRTLDLSKAIKELNLEETAKKTYDWGLAWASVNEETGKFSTEDSIVGSDFSKNLNSLIKDYGKLTEETTEFIEKMEEAEQKGGGFFFRLSVDVVGFIDDYSDQILQFAELSNSLNDIFQVRSQNRLNAIVTENDLELDLFNRKQDEMLERFDLDQQHEKDSFMGTQQQKADFEKQKGLERLEFEKQQEQKRDALRKKQLEKENEVARSAFNANKANSIGQIAIDTAVAIAKTIAQLGGVGAITPAGAALIALMGATGTAQAAAVGSEKFQPKTFQDGGMIEGASHSEGGVPFTVAGRAGFEAEGGEYIFSRNTVDRLGTGLLDAINFGGAAPRMFADGGAVSRASVASSALNQSEMAQMIGEVVASSVTQIPVVNVATETDSLSRMVQNAEAMATI